MVAAIANLFENPLLSEGFKQILQNYPRLQEYLRRLKRAFKKRLSDRNETLEKPKLEYFGPFGRADPIRFCLNKAGIRFDDVTVTQEEWANRKAAGNAGEFGFLPILTIDGKEYG